MDWTLFPETILFVVPCQCILERDQMWRTFEPYIEDNSLPSWTKTVGHTILIR